MITFINKIRTDFEKGTVNGPLLRKLYKKYNPSIRNLEEFVKEALHIFPNLNCGLTAVYLKHLLGGDIIKGKFKVHNHTFLVIKNLVVDITADQYGGPKVYVGPLTYPWAK